MRRPRHPERLDSLEIRARIGAISGGNVVTVESAVTPGGDVVSVGMVLLQLEETF